MDASHERESPLLVAGEDPIDELDRLAQLRDYPTVLRCDNGPELACAAMADLVGIATANDERRGNYPAAIWLDEEGWDAPTLLDDAYNAAAQAVGVSRFPFMVFVGANGTVVSRATGELTPDELNARAAELMPAAC
jgi:hypothetical protein